MTANTNRPASSKPPNRREFTRRASSLSGRLSLTTDFSKPWEVKVTNISLTGMLLTGEIPQIPPGPLYVRLDGLDVTIGGFFIMQSEAGLHLKVTLDDLQLAELVTHSELYASLVLGAIPD
ncbi:PilZ domain-containing protein [Nisaea denitrificans]|uniref:PilZ domain-containing protein n=1 Tax=Nisaea denitrificans TaxID=390877 RepID=UPI0012ECA4EF|nr:PilZ domain-containing protein [Nisaea denitrificans]